MKTTKTLLGVLTITLALAVQGQAQFTWTTNNGTITITGYTGSGGVVTIPSTITGLAVTSIGNSAFRYKTSLASVTIPDTVTNIGSGAFYLCTRLTNVTMGSAVATVGSSAFSSCISLTNVAIPMSVTSIGSGAFSSCLSLTNVAIPRSVASIGIYAFSHCTNLKAITVDLLNPAYSSLDGVLFNKSQTTLIEYPGGITGGYTIPNSVTAIGSSAFEYCTNLASVTIGTNVTYILDSAFLDCYSLADVTIPSRIIYIGNQAFWDCTSLTNVAIPRSVASIGIYAFSHCTNLKAITVDLLNPAYSSLDGVLFNKNQTTLIQYPGGKPGSYAVPGSVTTIEYYAFAACHGLTSVTIPNSVGDIPEQTFIDCTSLTNAAIPSSVTSIGYQAFYGCTSLKTITVDLLNPAYSSLDGVLFNKSQTTLIQYPGGKLGSYNVPNGVTDIADQSFFGCQGLTNITIPNSVTAIDHQALFSCGGLIGVYFKGNAPSLGGSGVFDGDDNATIYYFPGTTGWGPTFGGRPTLLWNPQMQTSDASFGVRTNCFGFNITGTSFIPVVVEACTNLASANWTTLQIRTITNGSIYFSDPQWTNYPGRFYRIRSP